MTLQVAAGVQAFVVAGDGFEMCLKPFKTTKLNIFSVGEVYVDPSGRSGRHGPETLTSGGNYARLGYYVFRQSGRDLMVHRDNVQEVA